MHGGAAPADVEQMMGWLMGEDFTPAFNNMWGLMSERGLALQVPPNSSARNSSARNSSARNSANSPRKRIKINHRTCSPICSNT